MQAVIANGKMFCNGAEVYVGEDKPWHFICNFEGKYWRHELACIELSGYKAVIDNRATNVAGEELPDTFAILVPEELREDPDQIQARKRYFELDGELRDAYKEKLIKFGVVSANFFEWPKSCYIGCEAEYGLILPDNF